MSPWWYSSLQPISRFMRPGRMTRRDFIRRSVLWGMGAAGAGMLAGCAVPSTATPVPPTATPAPTTAPAGPRWLNSTQYGPDFVYGDPRPDAPELAPRGKFGVGVRRLDLVNPNQIDILNYSESNPEPRYDRPLGVMVWYPAIIPPGVEMLTTYSDTLGSGPGNPDRPIIPFEFTGRALRDAEPDRSEAPYPLIILSHGYPGSAVLLTNLTENLASKGYIVAAIEHTDSTHWDATKFASTLLNRPLDILFVLNEMGKMGQAGSGSFLAGMVDDEHTALMGYSMGGYGVLNVAGAGFRPESVDLPWGVPGGHLAVRVRGNPQFEASLDPRVKAIVPMAPWGAPYFFDDEGLKGIKVPAFFIVGDQDDTAGFQNVKYLFEKAVHSDRYMLVYQGGIHEVVVNPAPFITNTSFREYMHYQEPCWDNMRCNNINQHFLTAFLGRHLKGIEEYQAYLDVPVPIANQAKWSQNPDGTFKEDHTYWKGFRQWTCVGLELHHLPAEA